MLWPQGGRRCLGAEGDEADTHMKELEALKETDPEFYKWAFARVPRAGL